MVEFLAQNPGYPPARLRVLELQPLARTGERADALVEVDWGNQRDRFAVEIKARSQPRILALAMAQAEERAQALDVRPMVFLPFLTEEALRQLEARNISGIDLCGNALILGSAFRVWRGGMPNQFRESRPIQNPYSGDSSIFARCFLLENRFESLTALREFALSRYRSPRNQLTVVLQLGTASKVVQTLQDEMIVAKDRDTIVLTDPARLLRNLERRYRRLETPTMVGKTPLGAEEVWSRLADWGQTTGHRYVATGAGSAARWGVLFGSDRLSLYVDSLQSAGQTLQIEPKSAFANIEIIEEKRGLVYFDASQEGPALWASKIQTWLELAQGDAREQEASDTLYRQLLEAARGGNA